MAEIPKPTTAKPLWLKYLPSGYDLSFLKEEDPSFVVGRESPVEKAVFRRAIPAWVESIMADLTPREKQVISLRFGFDGNEPMTRSELAKHVTKFAPIEPGKPGTLTTPRLRQIEAKALAKIILAISGQVGFSNSRGVLAERSIRCEEDAVRDLILEPQHANAQRRRLMGNMVNWKPR